MMILPNLTTTFLFASASGLISAYVGHRRGHNLYVWFFIGFFFGMIGMLTLFFIPKKKAAPLPAPKLLEPERVLSGPNNKFWYYLDPSNNRIGPMSHNAITKDWKLGKISPETLVWHEDLEDWKMLRELVKE